MAGAPIGNKNATKNKPWINALNRAIAQRDADDLRKIADKLISLAMEGDLNAIKELGDRLDGKATQGIDADINIVGNLAVLIEAARKRIENAVS